MNFGDDRLPDRFWDKVSPCPMSGCWLWTGGIGRGGYAKYQHNKKTDLGHRVAFIAANGSVPGGLELDHLCRVRCCVNPHHLEAVTRRVNQIRGVAPWALNARKTHCSKGHALSAENLVPSKIKLGERICLICFREYDRAAKARRRLNRRAHAVEAK